jgi:hypothetical protein
MRTIHGQETPPESSRTICRRKFLGYTALLVTLGSALMRRDAQAQTKMSQEQARYQGQPKGERKCADCKYFVADQGACQRVEGKISANGWCMLWAAKG